MRRDSLRAATSWSAALVAGIGASLLLPAHAAEPGAPADGLGIGDTAVDFALPGVDGKMYRLRDFAGTKVLVVVFTCNHCPTAQLYESRIQGLAREFRARGVALVAISPNDPEAVRLDELGYTDVGDSLADMQVRAQERRFDFPYLYDGDSQAVSRAYGPAATPHVFVFDRARKLRYSGRIDDSESGRDIGSRDARDAILALLDGGAPPKEKTRVFGCSIKWSDKRGDNRRFLAKLARLPVKLDDLSIADVPRLRENKSGKLRLVNLWATWCAPCVAEFPELVTTDRMYRHRDFEFVSLSIDAMDDRDRALQMLKKFEASNRNLIYSSSSRDALADAMDPSWSGALPLTLLIAPGGKIVYRRVGRVDVLDLRRTIVRELAPWK